MSNRPEFVVDEKSITVKSGNVTIIDFTGDKHILLLYGHRLVEELEGSEILYDMQKAISMWADLRGDNK